MNQEIKSKLEDIADAIADAGLVPYDQMYGYFLTGNTLYITRNRNARTQIQHIKKKDLEMFLNGMNEQR